MLSATNFAWRFKINLNSLVAFIPIYVYMTDLISIGAVRKVKMFSNVDIFLLFLAYFYWELSTMTQLIYFV